MDGMEKIIARIESDAREQNEALRRETEEKINAIRGEFEKRAEQERAALRARSAQAAQERYERLCSASDMESRKLELAAKQEILDETYALALEQMCTMPRDRYEELLLKLLGKAVGDGREKLVFSAKDRAALGEDFVARANTQLHTSLTLAGETADIRAGFVLVGEASDVNCSFETLLALGRERTEGEAAGRLFS